MRRFGPAIGAGCASLAVSAAVIVLRPDTRGAGFLFGDEAANLFVADALHRGQRLYADVAYQYGQVPITLYRAISALLGNTPLVYLWTLAVLAAGSAAGAAHLIRRAADARTTIAITVVGLLPTLPLPGAPIGGFTSSIYSPVERLGVLAALLLWSDPATRRRRHSIALGGVLGLCQGVRFGTGAVLLAAVCVADAAGVRRSARRDVLRSLGWVLAAFALVELAWIGWSLLTLPRAVAADVLWPRYMVEAYRASWSAPWPVWAGWRMAVTQGVMPAMASVLALIGSVRAVRRGSFDAHSIALLFFACGAVFFFRNEYHFRQFAWLLPVGAAPAAARLSRRTAAMVLLICLPALEPVASAFVHAAPATVDVDVPRGYRLFVGEDVAARVHALEPYAHEGPVLFVPNGMGWLYAYGVPNVTRHAWFYSPVVVRPFEEREFEAEAARANVLIRCGSQARDAWPFRPEIAAFLEAAFRRDAAAADCAIWKHR